MRKTLGILLLAVLALATAACTDEHPMEEDGDPLEDLIAEQEVEGGMQMDLIRSNLGEDIEWESDDESLIDPETGDVAEVVEVETVTLTARLVDNPDEYVTYEITIMPPDDDLE